MSERRETASHLRTIAERLRRLKLDEAKRIDETAEETAQAEVIAVESTRAPSNTLPPVEQSHEEIEARKAVQAAIEEATQAAAALEQATPPETVIEPADEPKDEKTEPRAQRPARTEGPPGRRGSGRGAACRGCLC